MTKSIKSIAAVCAFAAVTTLSSCVKEKLPNLNAPVQNNNNTSFVIINAALDDVKGRMSYILGSFKKEENEVACTNITIDTVSMPHVMTIDYGTGCFCRDRFTRSGQVIIYYNYSDFKVAGSYDSITYVNYFIEGQAVSGNHVMTNIGTNGNGNLVFHLEANLTKIENGNTASRNVIADYEWVQGSSTPTVMDDLFSITGGGNGVMGNGNSYTDNTITPLIRNYNTNCAYYVQGEAVIQEQTKPDRFLDFGNGTCTGKVTETINGASTVKDQRLPKGYDLVW